MILICAVVNKYIGCIYNLQLTNIPCSRYKTSEKCPARGQINRYDRLVLNENIPHRCQQSPEELQLQLAKHRLKEAAKKATGPLSDEYKRIITKEEEYVQSNLPYPKVKRFMKTSRDESLEPNLRTMDNLLAFLEKQENPLVQTCYKDTVRFEEPGEHIF